MKNSETEIILNAQDKVFAFDKGEKEALTEIFRLEHELEKLKAPELTKREHLSEAYILHVFLPKP